MKKLVLVQFVLPVSIGILATWAVINLLELFLCLD